MKALGGWSLELKNLESPCHDYNNWSASENSLGGTPGFENSIFSNIPSTSVPKILKVSIENDSIIHFLFDRNIDGGLVSISPDLSYQIDRIGSELTVAVNNASKNQIYEIVISGYSDCWGNMMTDYTYLFAKPDNIVLGDIILNEILFNPENGGADYVEIVNVSNKIIALDELQIANIKDGIIDNISQFSEQQILFFPGEYLLLTEDSMAIIETFPNYRPGQFHELDLPPFNNDSGTVVLMNLDSIVIDKFSYSEDMHFTLIDDLNGKALERLSFSQKTQSVDNWHTASEATGWGTPGYLNSQTTSSVFEKELQLSNAIFSPDNDGYQDVLEITYQFDNPDNVMDIVIFNANGQPIRELKDNFYPGKKGSIIWDGLTDEGTKAYVGTYIIGVTVFDLDGNLKRYKLASVLATRL